MKRPPAETPPLYAQDGKGFDAVVHARYFLGYCDWLVTEYDPAEDLAFGWACLNGDRANAELGYTSLTELADVRAPLSINGRLVGHVLPVEYDEHWVPCSITEAIELLDHRGGVK
jgi:hypothetical protein